MVVASAQVCREDSPCYSVEFGEVAVTTDGGGDWTPLAIPSGIDLYGIACTSATRCIAVGSTAPPVSYFSSGEEPPPAAAGVILATDNFGRTWVHQTVPSIAGILNGIACPTPLSCLAVGGGLGGVGAVVLSGNA
jgi:photosystem II stability/assembly factor-like uncharacterized protein